MPPMADLLAHLNPEQLAAVTLPAQSALVLAGAGSGKTRVLTTRIAWLISTGQASPGGVLAVTFTNKAAKEMLARLGALLPLPLRGMWIGTFHGLCNRFLRAHWKAAALPQTFQILDNQDQLSAIKRLLKTLNVDEQRAPAKQLQWFINAQKEQGLRAAECAAHDAHSRLWVELYAAYEAQCQREGVVDFAELLLRSYEVLRDHPDIRAHYRARFHHILVDEFQDTNRLQYRWLKLLAGAGEPDPAAVLAVGDDDQSIYAFRGAHVGNMDDFQREFGVRHLIKLERNYRSHANILDAANYLIAHNTRRLGKTLRTDAGGGEPVRVIEQPSEQQEALWLVDEIRLLLREGYARDQIAVLYRANAQSRAIESALFNAAVPYKVYGGMRFFERAEIKHALAYMRLLHNPRDDTSLLRVVNFPPRGIGARSIEQLQDAARAADCALVDAVDAVGGRAGTGLRAFVELLDRARADTAALSLPELVRHVLEVSGLLEHFRAERDGQDRVENLEELVNAATAFVTQEGFGLDARAQQHDERPLIDADTGETLSPLAAFLAHAALEAGDNQAQSGQDAVQLMTVHAAKGLEFDAVFITGLEEGLFPHDNAMQQADGVEEERRLMYVAITRARRRLYLSCAQSRILHGQTRYNLRSRFLEELPEEALKWLSAKRGETPRAAWASAPSAPTAAAAPSFATPRAASRWRVGQRVFHGKFGEGTLLSLEGQGDDERAQVRFNRHGVKWLALALAKLQPVD
jgi:DNA helicase-2/ATP-dependent DNA helicase PcrA